MTTQTPAPPIERHPASRQDRRALSALALAAGWSGHPADRAIAEQAGHLVTDAGTTAEIAAVVLAHPAYRLAALRGTKARGRDIGRHLAEGGDHGGARERIRDAVADAAELRRAGVLPARTDRRDQGYAHQVDHLVYVPSEDRPGTLAEMFAEVLGVRGAAILAPTGRVAMRDAGSLSARAGLVDRARRHRFARLARQRAARRAAAH